MDLTNIPIIDTHGHAFDPEREISDFRTYFNQSLWLPPMDIVKNTLINCTLIERLKEALNLDTDTDQEEVVLERNRQYRKSPTEYIKKLMKHAKLNVEKIYIDTGFPCEAFNGYSVDLEKFSTLMNMSIGSIYRLDISVCRILEELPLTFEEAICMLEYDLDKAIKIDKVSGIKSFIAYETGLDIRKCTAKEASLAYNRLRGNKNKWDEKILQDYFVVEALKKCCEHGLPMQFHTGLGSPPIVKLSQANPILMEDILADKEIRETKVMFLHSGLPFTAQAGYMTSVYPNCYCDLSGILVNFGIAFKKAFSDLLVYGSSSRITFGSDGIMVPETYWISYSMGLKLIGDVFDEMVSGGWLNKKDAFTFAEMIINKNAKGYSGNSMDVFTEERQAEILKRIDIKGRISVEELARDFNVSEATIRRDLKTISSAYPNIQRTYGGAIKKTHPLHGAFWHGGFESMDNNENITLQTKTEEDYGKDLNKITFPENFSKTEITNMAFSKVNNFGEGTLSQKDMIIRESNIRIAEFAVSFIGENDKIALEAAEINVLLAQKIPHNLNIKLFTNSPTISSIMSGSLCAADVYCSGGFLNKDYNAFLDLKAIEFFNEFFTDKAFISIDAIDSNYMISTFLKEKAEVKKNLIKSAKEKIVLCNSANLNTTLIFNAGNIRYADVLIIDKGVDEDFLKDLKNTNLRVYVV